MTDNEIITDYREEIEKPRYLTVGIFWNVLDLIKRQKAENENLQELLVKTNAEIAKQETEIERLKSDISVSRDAYTSMKDRYEYEKEKVEKSKQKCIDIAKALQTAKSEARKEFAEKVKEIDGNSFLEEGHDGADEFWWFDNESYETCIDNLLEEMEKNDE